jgi:hypothetical protein
MSPLRTFRPLLSISTVVLASLAIAGSASAQPQQRPNTSFVVAVGVPERPKPTSRPHVGFSDEQLGHLSGVEAYTLRNGSGQAIQPKIAPLGKATREQLALRGQALREGRPPTPVMNMAFKAGRDRQKTLRTEASYWEHFAAARKTPLTDKQLWSRPGGPVAAAREHSQYRAEGHIRAVVALGQELEHAPPARWPHILNRAADNLNGAAQALRDISTHAPYADFGIRAGALADKMTDKAAAYRSQARAIKDSRAQASEREAFDRVLRDDMKDLVGGMEAAMGRR